MKVWKYEVTMKTLSLKCNFSNGNAHPESLNCKVNIEMAQWIRKKRHQLWNLKWEKKRLQ